MTRNVCPGAQHFSDLPPPPPPLEVRTWQDQLWAFSLTRFMRDTVDTVISVAREGTPWPGFGHALACILILNDLPVFGFGRLKALEWRALGPIGDMNVASWGKLLPHQKTSGNICRKVMKSPCSPNKAFSHYSVGNSYDWLSDMSWPKYEKAERKGRCLGFCFLHLFSKSKALIIP